MDLLTYEIPVWVVIAVLIYNAAVQALPRPDDASSRWYVWAYQFAHLLAANVVLALDPRKKHAPADEPHKPE